MQIVKLSVTVKHRLECKYGRTKFNKIKAAIKDWIKADALRGICTKHVEVDDSTAMKEHGLKPVKLVDGKATPLDIKRAIDCLWEKITPTPDYLVLFGGCDIVPMFVLPNPFDPRGDNDWLPFSQREKVPTDNPYASSLRFRPMDRRSYLIPDRVIGRIPDVVFDKRTAWLVRYLNTATNWKPKRVDHYMKTYA